MARIEKGIEKVFWRRRLSRISKKELTPIQTVRIVMFGLGGVGKTSLIHRFLYEKFEDTYTATIEDDYRQVITYNDHIVDVTVLDTAGSFQFPAMRKHAIQNGQGFLLVYAFNNPHSLSEVDRIFSEISSLKGECDKLPIILVGNKTDLEKNLIDREQVDELLRSWEGRVEHIETSAKFDENVSLLFNKMISIIDEAKIKKQDVGSIGFSTTYDQNSNSVKRTFSVDETAIRKGSIIGHNVRSQTINSNHPTLGMNNPIDKRYSSQILTWKKSEKEKNETSKVKKKQRALYGIFSRKFVT